MKIENKIVAHNKLGDIRSNHKSIAMCSGCYDILQSGHAVFFQQCKAHADTLVVCTGIDEVIRSLKGPTRPVNPLNNRMYMLAALQTVDYVTSGGSEILPGKIDFADVLRQLRPDVFILNDDDSAIDEKRKLCDQLGVKLVLVSRIVPEFLEPTSTTKIIENAKAGLGVNVDSANNHLNISDIPEKLFLPGDNLSAAEISNCLAGCDEATFGGVFNSVFTRLEDGRNFIQTDPPQFIDARIFHTFGSVIADLIETRNLDMIKITAAVEPNILEYLRNTGCDISTHTSAASLAQSLKASAMKRIEKTIIQAGKVWPELPHNTLRSDEIVWGRSPARIDLGGGWSDTPPYSLTHGGRVLNFALDLKGQPPIHCYARVIDKPIIKLGSIDIGRHVEIKTLDELMDFGSPDCEFALSKAALAISGFSPAACDWPADITLREMLEKFGGGIELTTMAAIPKGSGLGTSSIVGVTLMGVINRLLGRNLTTNELFYEVLRLEQALTTGGGWQDQFGGGIGGVKILSAKPAVIPDVSIQYLPDDIINPQQCLLYYTGVTRLAKNVLQQVVGNYLNRDASTLRTIQAIADMPEKFAQAIMSMDIESFGAYINESWELNKTLAPSTSNDEIEEILNLVKDGIIGAKLAGAGGGGFLFMVCKSPDHATQLRNRLENKPINPRARIFDYSLSSKGLRVTVC